VLLDFPSHFQVENVLMIDNLPDIIIVHDDVGGGEEACAMQSNLGSPP